MTNETIKATDLMKVQHMTTKQNIPEYAYPLALGEDTKFFSKAGNKQTWNEAHPAVHKVVIGKPGRGKIICRLRLFNVANSQLITNSDAAKFSFKVGDVFEYFEVVAVGLPSNDATMPDLKVGDFIALENATFGVSLSPTRKDVKYYLETEENYIGRGFHIVWDTIPVLRVLKDELF